MKVYVVLALCSVTVAACNDSGGAGSASSRSGIGNKKDSLSYFFGTSIGNSMRRDSLDMNVDMIAAGVRDALKGDTTVLADSGYMRLVQSFSAEMQTKAMAREEKKRMEQATSDSLAAAKNKPEGDAYLAQNKAKADVVTLPSGLQYKVVTEGTGPNPKATDRVLVRYRGTKIDGTPFDSSGVTPVTMGINEVVPGFKEALQKMKVGSKWQVAIPPGLAYGEQAPPSIGPNAVLLFDLELVGIVPPGQEPEPIQMPGAPPGHP